MRGPETLLETMEIQLDRGVEQNWPYRQIEATLILAEQVKRIADLLEEITWQPEYDQQRALIVIQPHAEGSIRPG